MSSKLAKFAEHSLSTTTLPDLGGNGVLASKCPKCSGKLDFTRVKGETVLQCRECKEIVSLD